MPGGGGRFSSTSEAQQEHAGLTARSEARRMVRLPPSFHVISSLHSSEIKDPGTRTPSTKVLLLRTPSSIIAAGQPPNGRGARNRMSNIPTATSISQHLLLRHPSLKPEAQSLESEE